ncbi:VTT domain-containing protein [Brevibacillus agri]|uniref:TVP38/TMEM64 family protein n=1 Tax=Brevibacillus TaxID=55080 RepID=UPI002E21C439|nr:VTT domain-containing protein [Brevibacillus agri]MED1657511.1 VTT domain-containing protein [Brevibacillus agri]MED1690101.1 VTT domain-containing protein [Brevibacillus agri]MED1694417.1 VTT domain-containing protein [Brevibacillus agri]MED1700279.1 VTT domain-containing protein [Brevibacillus agri]
MDWITNVEAIAEWLRSWGVIAVAGSILLNVVISITGVLPSIFLSGANAIVFGLMGGFIVSLAGEVTGAVLAFLLYRWGVGKSRKLKKWSESKWVLSVNHSSRLKQLAGIVLLRVNPLLPSGFVNFGASLTRISLFDFLLATLIGKIPSMVFETFVAHDIVFISENKSRLAASLILGSLVFLIFWSSRKRGKHL